MRPSHFLSNLDRTTDFPAKKMARAEPAGDAQLIVRQSAPAIMHTPARPPLLDARPASRQPVTVEIESVRAQALLLGSRSQFVEAAQCWQAFLEQHPAHA